MHSCLTNLWGKNAWQRTSKIKLSVKEATRNSLEEVLFDKSDHSCFLIPQTMYGVNGIKSKYCKWDFIWMVQPKEFPQRIQSLDSLHLKPKYTHTNSPNWSLYISLKNVLREFGKRSRHFLYGDHFINSHYLVFWQRIDISRRKLMLVTIGT